MLRKVPREWERPWEDWGEPQAEGVPSTALTRHAKARIEYLARRREGETIDNQIAALRELAQPEPEPALEPAPESAPAPAPALELTEPPATDWGAVRRWVGKCLR